MEPKLVDRDGFFVMGLLERVPPPDEEHAFFRDIWKRYMAHHKTIEALSDAKGWYGVCFDVEPEGALDYLAGMAVPADAACPDGLVVRGVPAGRYAVFACTVATIHDTYEHIFHSWLDASPCVHDAPKPCFEHYGPGTDSDGSEVWIHIPIREKESQAEEAKP